MNPFQLGLLEIALDPERNRCRSARTTPSPAAIYSPGFTPRLVTMPLTRATTVERSRLSCATSRFALASSRSACATSMARRASSTSCAEVINSIMSSAPLIVALGLVERRLIARHRSLGLVERIFEPRSVDLEQRRALGHLLVVDDQHGVEQPRNIGSHLDDVGLDPSIPRPRRLHVIRPQLPADDDGEGDGDQRDGNASNRGKHTRIIGCHSLRSGRGPVAGRARRPPAAAR